MESLLKDVRFAVRTLFRNRGFALVAILTIGLGIGANTATFSVVQAVLLRPLPYPDADRLVLVWGRMTSRNIERFPSSPPTLEDFRREATLFEDLLGVLTFSQAMNRSDGDPQEIQVGTVTGALGSVLGVQPGLGRDFTEDDAAPGGDPVPGNAAFYPPKVAILSHGLWQRSFGADPDVLGTTIELGGSPVEIVGVMPRDFELLLPTASGLAADADVWSVARVDISEAPRENVFYTVIGRLRPGVTLEQAREEMDRIAAGQRERSQVLATSGYEIGVHSMHDELTRGARPMLLALLGAVAFVLLIACANVTNLLLVRATGRQREMAIRAAIGGGRVRLFRQMIMESAVLAFLGGGLGILLAAQGIDLLLALQTGDLPRIDAVRIDGGVLAFTLAATVLAALLFGIVPALQGARTDVAESLKERGHSSSGSGRPLLRSGVVVAEVALSLALLIGAGLMIRSFVELQRTDPGYDAEGVLTFRISLPFVRYPDPLKRSVWTGELRDHLAALPGVRAVSATTNLPLTGQPFSGRYGTEEALADPNLFQQARYRIVLPGYFQAMGTRLLDGRVFDEVDNIDSLSYVVVDERLAAMAWPGRSPVGEKLYVRLNSVEPEEVEVIGVVEHQRSRDLARDDEETVYFTHRWAGSAPNLTWVVRSGSDPGSLGEEARRAVADMDPLLPVAEVRTMGSIVGEARSSTRFALVLITAFGITALVLAVVGLYGVLAFAVRQRTAEIGIRMAFGAEAGSILGLVVRQGLALTLVGIGAGLVTAMAVTRGMQSMLVGVEPGDPLTFAATSAVFLAVALVASLLPARRASRVDPMVALREE